MRILCAPDSFKEVLTAEQVGEAMEAGIHRSAGGPHGVERCPMADGGEGTLDALAPALGALVHTALVGDPLSRTITARFGVATSTGVGVVELAAASGLARLGADERDPERTTTFGTGQLIRRAAALGGRQVILGLGGSATIDGGTGLAQALGARFFDRHGRLLPKPMTGGLLVRVHRFQRPQEPPSIRAACDVSNPLCGPEGAAAVYGPQKGATARQIEILDGALGHLCALADLDPFTPGFGAAGGAGFGAVAFLGAQLESGSELVLTAVQLEQRCRAADLVLTGEGRLDGQSLSGKAVLGVARAAGRAGVPSVAIVGDLGPGWETCVDPRRPDRLAGCVSLTERFGRARARTDAASLIAQVAGEVVMGRLRPS